MRWLVLWLFADLVFRLNNFTKKVGFLLVLALITPGHPFVASRQQLPFILLPSIKSRLFFFVRERVILDNILRFVEVRLGVYNSFFKFFRHRHLHYSRFLNAGYSALRETVSESEKQEVDERDNQADGAPDVHLTNVVDLSPAVALLLRPQRFARLFQRTLTFLDAGCSAAWSLIINNVVAARLFQSLLALGPLTANTAVAA